MYSTGDYQIVVTYRDGNGVWKVRPVDDEDITASATSAGERDVDCFIPEFWGSVPRSARIEHVAFHADFEVRGTMLGRTFHLPWPPPEPDRAPRPALAMHMRLRYDPDDTPGSVEWNPSRASENVHDTELS